MTLIVQVLIGAVRGLLASILVIRNFALTEFALERLHLPVESIKFEVYHHFSGLSFIAEVNFWRPPKTVVSCDLFTNNYHNHLLQTGFSEYMEVIATSLIPLVTNFPEICAFINGFSFTVWAKMRPLLAH